MRRAPLCPPPLYRRVSSSGYARRPAAEPDRGRGPEGGNRGPARSYRDEQEHPQEAGAPGGDGPEPVAARKAGGHGRRHEHCDCGDDRGSAREGRQACVERGSGAFDPADRASIRRGLARERDTEAGDDDRGHGGHDGGDDERDLAHEASCVEREHRDERQRVDRREERSGEEQEPGTCVAGEKEQPGERERDVGDGEPERDVAEREDGDGERHREPGGRAQQRDHAGERPEQEGPARGEERQEQGGPGRRTRPPARHAAPARAGRSATSGAAPLGALLLDDPQEREAPASRPGACVGRRRACGRRRGRARAAGRGGAGRAAGRPARPGAPSRAATPPRTGAARRAPPRA